MAIRLASVLVACGRSWKSTVA